MACRYSSCVKCYQDDRILGFKVSRVFNDESDYYRRRRRTSLNT